VSEARLFLQLFVEEAEAVPRCDDWLCRAERDRLAAMRFAKRRADFRLGRWTSKRAVASYLGRPLAARDLRQIEIASDEDGAPEVFVDGSRAACAISLSHREGRSLCAVAMPEVRVGCDLERVERRSEAFVDQFLAPCEAARVERAVEPHRSRDATLLWSAKESALKALRTGLAVDTRDVVVELRAEPSPRTWLPLRVCVPGEDEALGGFWLQDAGWLLTVVSRPASMPQLEDPRR